MRVNAILWGEGVFELATATEVCAREAEVSDQSGYEHNTLLNIFKNYFKNVANWK